MRSKTFAEFLMSGALALLLAACGGGGGGSGTTTPPPLAAPSALSYTSPVTTSVGSSIAPLVPTVTGTVTSYSASPALPAGLAIDSATGRITGTPTAATAQSTYTLTASNVSGSATFALVLAVNPQAPAGLSYSSPQSYVVGQAIAALTPTVATGSASSYSVAPPLPAGLSLDTATGQISGLPTAIAAQATYTVTAANVSGSTTFGLSITVIAPPAPTVTLSFNPAAVTQSTASVLTWSSTNATSCTASGAWSGAKATVGTANVPTPSIGTFTHTLTCQNTVGVTASASATLTVNAPPKFTLGAYRLQSVSGSVPVNAPQLGMQQFYDFDGDGWGDLIWTGAYYPFNGNNPTPQQGYVAFNGPSGFAAAAPAKFPYADLLDVHARELAFVDFNGDGRRDLFVADHGYDAPPFPGYLNRLFLSQAGAATWIDASANLPQQWEFTHSVCTGDVDSDGKVDIFVGNGGLSATYFLRGDGTGHFTKDSQILPINAGQALQNASVGLTSCDLSDLDGDGFPELILGTSYLSRGTQVLWSTAGSYATATVAGGTITSVPEPANFGTNWSIYEVQSDDLNGDGRPDLILVYNGDVSYGGWQFQFLVNQGNRQFVDQTSTYLPDPAAVSSGLVSASNQKAWIAFLRPRDLNSDGRMDYWVEANSQAGILSDDLPLALLRQGDGTFATVKVGELRAAGVIDGFFYRIGYVSRGSANPGELVSPFADANAGNQVKMNSQAITFH